MSTNPNPQLARTPKSIFCGSRRLPAWVKVLAFGAAASVPPWSAALAEDFERGAELFENHCRACHDKPFQVRENSEVHSLSELRKRIAGWGAHAGADWGTDETEDVLIYLNRTAYHFKDEPL